VLPAVVNLFRDKWFHCLAKDMLLKKGFISRIILHLETWRNIIGILSDMVVNKWWAGFDMVDHINVVSNVSQDVIA